MVQNDVSIIQDIQILTDLSSVKTIRNEKIQQKEKGCWNYTYKRYELFKYAICQIKTIKGL